MRLMRLGAITFLAALTCCAPASATSSPPSAAVQQYVETLPAAGGDSGTAAKAKPRAKAAAAKSKAAVPAAPAKRTATPAPSTAAASAVQQYVETLPSAGGSPSPPRGGSHGALVEKIQTSSALGAPHVRLSGGSRPRAATDSAFGAAVNAVASGDSSHLLGLVLAMVLTTAILVVGRVLSRARGVVRSRGD